MCKYSFKYHSEENIQSLRNELSNNFDTLDEVNINERFNILNSIIEKAYFKNWKFRARNLAMNDLEEELQKILPQFQLSIYMYLVGHI